MNFNFYWKYIERPKRIFESYINRLLGWDNPILIQREVNQHRNELAIEHFAVIRLLGWTDQYDDDYCWVVQDGNEIKLHSCCGGFIWLKNRLNGFNYYQMVEWWNLNCLPLVDALKMVTAKGIKLK